MCNRCTAPPQHQSPIRLIRARWGCINQPSSTQSELKKISRHISCVNSVRWCSKHANDTTALHMFRVSPMPAGWISYLLVSNFLFCRFTEPSPLLAREPNIQYIKYIKHSKYIEIGWKLWPKPFGNPSTWRYSVWCVINKMQGWFTFHRSID